MSAVIDFVNEAKTIVEEISREELPTDALLQEMMRLQRLVTDAIAELTIREEPPK